MENIELLILFVNIFLSHSKYLLYIYISILKNACIKCCPRKTASRSVSIQVQLVSYQCQRRRNCFQLIDAKIMGPISAINVKTDTSSQLINDKPMDMISDRMFQQRPAINVNMDTSSKSINAKPMGTNKNYVIQSTFSSHLKRLKTLILVFGSPCTHIFKYF